MRQACAEREGGRTCWIGKSGYGTQPYSRSILLRAMMKGAFRFFRRPMLSIVCGLPSVQGVRLRVWGLVSV
jgi:hypothetical protein